MKFDIDDLRESLRNYQQEANDQFKDFAENDWSDIKNHMAGKGQQAGDYLKKSNGKVYQNSVEAFKKGVRDLDQWVNRTSVHKGGK